GFPVFSPARISQPEPLRSLAVFRFSCPRISIAGRWHRCSFGILPVIQGLLTKRDLTSAAKYETEKNQPIPCMIQAHLSLGNQNVSKRSSAKVHYDNMTLYGLGWPKRQPPAVPHPPAAPYRSDTNSADIPCLESDPAGEGVVAAAGSIAFGWAFECNLVSGIFH
ncbi:hypothetical protein Bbelb_443910, partial [Branchiostoma belcheri]